MARLRPTARDTSTIGVEQNSPIFTPGVANHVSLGGHRQVAGGHQLAPGGGGEPVDLGDHRLRDALDRLHELGADGEEVLVEGQRPAGHLGQVVPGREAGAGAFDDDHRAGDAPQRRDQLRHQLVRQGVALLGPVEGDPGDGPLVLHDQVVGLHGDILPLSGRRGRRGVSNNCHI